MCYILTFDLCVLRWAKSKNRLCGFFSNFHVISPYLWSTDMSADMSSIVVFCSCNAHGVHPGMFPATCAFPEGCTCSYIIPIYSKFAHTIKSIDVKWNWRKCTKFDQLSVLLLFYVHSCALINWNNFLFRCGCTPVPINWYFIVISPYFRYWIFVVISPYFRYLRTLCKAWSLVHSLELLGVSPGSKLCATFLNIAK